MATGSDPGSVHALRVERRRDRFPEGSQFGVGLCECGCGGKTNLARQNSTANGWTKGEPLRFILGHANRAKSRPPLCEDDFTIEDRGYQSPCWIKKGLTTNMGYGRVVISGRSQYAHRAMYEQEVGPIPPGLHLDHLCRQTKCIRPDHLEPVTHAKNLQRGNGAKLTEDQVREIRLVPSFVMTKDLAAHYGISDSQMSRVRRGLRFVLPPE